MTGLDGQAFRPGGRATFVVVDTLATCAWCERRIDVVADQAAGVNRHVKHVRIGERTEQCPGSGRVITSSPVGDLLDDAIARSRQPRGDH